MSNQVVRRKRVKFYDDNLPIKASALLDRAEAARYWYMLAKVDVVKELNPVKQGCCRYCHGIDNRYQFTLNEFRLARRQHQEAEKRIRNPDKRDDFDEQGGPGYTPNRKPNPKCPECHGHGIFYPIPINFDGLSPAARMLYNGIKLNRDGSIELKLRDRDRAMENLQRLMGLDLPPKQHIPDFDDLPDDVLDAAVEKAVSQGLVSLEEVEDTKTINSIPESVEYSK